MLIRFVLYGMLGWCIEVVWTAISSTASRAQTGLRLRGETYLWMFPIYGLLAPLYEPGHELVRRWPWPARGVLYAAGFMLVEYASGWLLRRLTAACPWDYTGRCRWQIHGLMRLDYTPLWMLLGLALEPVHDLLVRLTPTIQAALRCLPSGWDVRASWGSTASLLACWRGWCMLPGAFLLPRM